MTPLHVVYHVPKTGGQTIRGHLDRHLERGVDFLHLGRWDQHPVVEYDDLVGLSGDARLRLRSVSGHPVAAHLVDLFPGRAIREVVFVREPAARLVSHYNFRCTMRRRQGEPIGSLDDFLAEVGPDPMTRFLALRFGLPSNRLSLSALLARLSRVWMVGTTERMDELTPVLFASMGLPAEVPERRNVTGVSVERHAELTPALADELRTANQLDAMLFRACTRLHGQTVRRLVDDTAPPFRRPVGFVPR